MTNDEFERLKESLRARQSVANYVDPGKAAAEAKLAKERRKLDRDLDRLERVLKKIVDAPLRTKRQLEEDERWKEFTRSSDKRFAEIKELGARTDAKIKALQEDMQKRRDAQEAS